MASSAQTFPNYSPINVAMIEAGIPIETMTAFLTASGVSWKLIYDVVIPARTLKHRRAKSQHLSTDESDKLARLIRVYSEAVRVFGDREKAHHWLGQTKHRFQERTPFEMLKTEAGARLVDEMLGQIDHGMFA